MMAADLPEDGSRCWWKVSALESSPAIAAVREAPGALLYPPPAVWLMASAPAIVSSGRVSTALSISAAGAPAALAAVPAAVSAAA